MPAHFNASAFIVQVAAHLGHEADVEDTFSLSGKLSNRNGCTQPGHLCTLTRVNRNKRIYKPKAADLLAEYMKQYRRLPRLGEDVDPLDADAADEGSGTPTAIAAALSLNELFSSCPCYVLDVVLALSSCALVLALNW